MVRVRKQSDITHSELDIADTNWRASFRRKMIPWFRKSARDLPWRATQDPYKIWVSEIMLQQTQVATVIAFYSRFLKRFPKVQSLAAATETEVLRNWEGLGYYRRARQMHAAARQIVDRHSGVFPTKYEEVLALPGIGRYTAGAILSFSSDQRLPIVEANTIRLYARLIGLESTVEASASQNCLWKFAELILPRKRCGDFNQSLMELGSIVCTPKDPNCERCPVSAQCIARIKGKQDVIPVRKKRRKFEEIEESILIVRRNENRAGGSLLMRICGEDEWWTGMWDFPRFRIPAADTRQLVLDFHELTGVTVKVGPAISQMKHTVTHHNISLTCFSATVSSGRLKTGGNNQPGKSTFKWVARADLENYPLCVTARKIVNKISL